MESQIETISKKEMELRKIELSQRQEGVTNLTVSNEKERKQLWDEWKTKHPESKKTWRTNNKQSSKTLIPSHSHNKESVSNHRNRASQLRGIRKHWVWKR